MGLTIVANPTFKGPAAITVVGEAVPVEINVVWKHKTMEQVGEWFEANKSRPAVDGLLEIIEDCPDLLDKDGQPVAFSRESLQTLLSSRSAAAGELVGAYLVNLTESRVKNSKALPGN